VVPEALAVSNAVCTVETAETVAVNPALDDPAGMVTVAGTLTALSLLVRLTVKSFEVTESAVTVHASVAAPRIAVLLQVSALSSAGAAPDPLRLTATELFADVLLIVS
jgi:hypothetical protein